VDWYIAVIAYLLVASARWPLGVSFVGVRLAGLIRDG
jgi:hypothetical protein